VDSSQTGGNPSTTKGGGTKEGENTTLSARGAKAEASAQDQGEPGKKGPKSVPGNCNGKIKPCPKTEQHTETNRFGATSEEGIGGRRESQVIKGKSHHEDEPQSERKKPL